MFSRIILKSDEEIELIRKNCLLVSETLAMIASELKEGMTGEQIDKKAEDFIRDHDSLPGFKGLYGFPSTLCISINEAVVHGVPSKVPFKSGDIVSVDCGVYANEFYGDAAYTFAIGEVSEDIIKLCVVTKESLQLGIDQAVVNNRIGDISYAIQNHCQAKHGYGVVRELVGHGLGKKLHEKPEVPNYGIRGKGPKIENGLVIAIEPMINLGRKEVMQAPDGNTIVTKDGKASAHYEHTIAVRNGVADILSDHGVIEKEIDKNKNLKKISLKKQIFAHPN